MAKKQTKSAKVNNLPKKSEDKRIKKKPQKPSKKIDIMQIAEEIMDEYDDVFRKLSKT